MLTGAAIVGGMMVGALAASAASTDKGVAVNPSQGLTNSQRLAEYQQMRAAFNSRYEAWLTTLDLGSLPFSRLERLPILGTFVGPQVATLPEAVGAASLIVSARVVKIVPTAFAGTQVVVAVTSVLKGAAVGDVVITQPGGLRPTSDWKGITIAYAPNDPLLLPGEQALLLLNRTGPSGEWTVQPVTGLYYIEGNTLHALPDNPFGNAVERLGLSAVASEIAAVANR